MYWSKLTCHWVGRSICVLATLTAALLLSRRESPRGLRCACACACAISCCLTRLQDRRIGNNVAFEFKVIVIGGSSGLERTVRQSL